MEYRAGTNLLGPNTLESIPIKRFNPRPSTTPKEMYYKANREFNDLFIKSLEPGSEITPTMLAAKQNEMRQFSIGYQMHEINRREFFQHTIYSMRRFGDAIAKA